MRLLPRLMPGLPASVLLTTDAVGGIWTYALDLGGALAARGARVTLAVLGPPAPPAGRAAAAQAGVDLVETGLRPEWLADDAAEVIEAAGALAALAGARGVDLVHLNHPALGAAASFGAPVLAACHSCVATWWDAVRGTPLPVEFGWRTDLVAQGYRAADALVAPTRAFADATQRRYGLPAGPAVVGNGRAPVDAAPADDPPEDAVLTAGRLWDEGKNVAALDRAAARLALPVRAAGPVRGPNGAAITLGHVEALGNLEEDALRLRLARRPIYAAPALYEPFGLAVLEAAQAGCALVLGDIPTFRELWGGAALFVPPRDEAALADAITRLRADPRQRERLGRAAQRRAGAFTLEAFVDGIAALYGQIRAPAGRMAVA